MNYSSDSDYELLSSANLNHESDSEFYTNPYIDSDGEIYYGDTRSIAHIADWDAAKSIATELGDDTGKHADTSDLEVITQDMGDDLALNVQEHSTQEEIPTMDTDITVEKDQNNRRASYPSIIWVINALNIAREQDTEILEGTDNIHQSGT